MWFFSFYALLSKFCFFLVVLSKITFIFGLFLVIVSFKVSIVLFNLFIVGFLVCYSFVVGSFFFSVILCDTLIFCFNRLAFGFIVVFCVCVVSSCFFNFCFLLRIIRFNFFFLFCDCFRGCNTFVLNSSNFNLYTCVFSFCYSFVKIFMRDRNFYFCFLLYCNRFIS